MKRVAHITTNKRHVNKTCVFDTMLEIARCVSKQNCELITNFDINVIDFSRTFDGSY